MSIDVGYLGPNHHHSAPYLETLAQTRAKVTCACEPSAFDPTGIEALGDVPVYSTPEALFANEAIDVAWVTLSNRDTPAAIRTALDYDVDVFTEKPAARTAADLEPVVAAAEDSDSTVCVAYEWRDHPIIRELRTRAQTDFFGDVRAFEARYLASSLAYRDTDHYLFDREASRGGVLQWLGVHWLDAVPWLLDDPITAVSASTVSGHEGVDVEDGATLQLRTAGGAIGTLRTGYYLPEGRYDTHIAIEGRDATCTWDPIGETFGFTGETTLELERMDDAETPTTEQVTHDYDPTPGYGGEWGLGFVERFFEARENDAATVPATLEDAVSTLRVLDAAYEAAESDRWVAVDSDRDGSTATVSAGERVQ